VENAFKILLFKPQGEGMHKKSRHRYEDDIKMYLKVIGYEVGSAGVE
jgi:hypothetical protein